MSEVSAVISNRPRVNIRYVCQTCGRIYKKLKLDDKFHDMRKHTEPVQETDIIKKVWIDGKPAETFDPRDVVRMRKLGVIFTPKDRS